MDDPSERGGAITEPGQGERWADGGDKETFPRLFGGYELLKRIGRGGMGVVYKARQISLDRIVAIKMLPPGTLADRQNVLRFRTEASAAGSMQHPNIVAVHEVGLCDGRHYLVMDYVEGQTLADLVREGPLPPERGARCVQTIAEAVQYAHERKILHRDLKPSNVLIDAAGQPRITDFGLAKRMESATDLTLSGQVLGSPHYMSPEQASRLRGKVGPRSDMYSLGAVLYHVLTGRPPFLGETLTEVLYQAVHSEPLSPRLLKPSLRGDLETICLKCLEKEPARRYPTARALSEELGRFLRREPILARPLGPAGKAWRWCRRRPGLAGLEATVLVLLLMVAVGSPLAIFRINRERLAALDQTRRAELNRYAGDIALAQQYLKSGNFGRARELIDSAAQFSPLTSDPRGWEWGYLQDRCQSDAEFVLDRMSSGGQLVISPDGRFLAGYGRYWKITLWDLDTRRTIAILGGESDLPTCACFSPDSRVLAFKDCRTNEVVFWDLDARAEKGRMAFPGFIGGMIFPPNGKELVVALLMPPDNARALTLWDLETGQKKATRVFPTHGGDFATGNEGLFTRDGKRLMIGDINGRVAIFDGKTLGLIREFPAHEEGISALALSPDGKILATGAAYTDTSIKLWDPATQQVLDTLYGHTGWVSSLSFSPDGLLLASSSADHTIRIWDIPSRREKRQLRGHSNEVSSLRFSPDGKRLYSIGRDGLVCAWSPASAPRNLGPERRRWQISSISLSPDGGVVAAIRKNGTVTLREIQSGREYDLPQGLGSNNRHVLYSAEGHRLFLAKDSGEISLWDLTQQREVRRLKGGAAILPLQRSRDGRFIVVAEEGNRIRVWSTGSWRQKAEWQTDRISSCALSPDDNWLVTGHQKGVVVLWDPLTGKMLRTLNHVEEATTCLAFSPDGRFLSASSEETSVTVWETTRFLKVDVLRGHMHGTTSLTFSPDGRRLATGSQDRDAVKLWDTATWRELITLESPGDLLRELAFSCDGERLLARNRKGDLLIWTAPASDDPNVR